METEGEKSQPPSEESPTASWRKWPAVLGHFRQRCDREESLEIEKGVWENYRAYVGSKAGEGQ